jgi:hypothetical protein
MKNKKIKLEDLNEVHFENARKIIEVVINNLTAKPDARLILPVLSAINNFKSTNTELDTDISSGLHDGLSDGPNKALNAGLRASLNSGLESGLESALRDGFDTELDVNLRTALHSALSAGLHAELDDGIRDGLHNGLDAELYNELESWLESGIERMLDAELYNELENGLESWLERVLDNRLLIELKRGLDTELDSELRAGLNTGIRNALDAVNTELYDEYRTAINKNKNLLKGLKLEYCGIYWSYWLIRYLIAYSFGCELDIKKIKLLLLFVNVCPIILKNKEGQIFGVKPTKIKWSISDYTREPFKFPIYELDADGESAVECLGLKLYYYKNLRLPEYIGKVKRKDWKAEWVLTEENQEIKRALLQEIEPEKLESVLDLKILDTYESKNSKYQLVEARNNPYPSRFRALKFECPTSKKPYLIRTHPNMTSAEAAVIEMNQGIHPDTFIWEC